MKYNEKMFSSRALAIDSSQIEASNSMELEIVND